MTVTNRLGCRLQIGMLVLGAVSNLQALPVAAQTPAPLARSVPQGPGSLSGVWVKTTEHFGSVDDPDMYDPRDQVMKTADGTPLPLQSWARSIVERRLDDADAGHPFASLKSQCLPGGVPDMMFGSGPMQILETAGQITILRQEFSFFRIIRVNATHPNHPRPTFLGDSTARWDGDTLVVDTVGISDKTTIKDVIPHSPELHVVERFRRSGKDSIEIVGTIEDPKTFTRPWTMETRLKLLPDGLTEYFCENNRNTTDATGHVASGAVSAAR